MMRYVPTVYWEESLRLLQQATADKKEMGYLSWLQSGKHPVLEEAYPLHVPKERRALSSKLKWSLMPWRKLEVDSVRNYYGR